MTAARRSARQPTASDLGLNGLSKRLLVLQVLTVIAVFLSFRHVRLSVDWRSAVPMLLFDAAVAALWVHLWQTPGRQQEWFVAETVAAFLLMLTASHILAPAQYAAAAFKRPLIDAALARADAAMGIRVADLVVWTHTHPMAGSVFKFAYFSFLPQLAVLIPVTGLLVRDREAMWEAVFHYHVCALVTVTVLAVFPAASAFQYLHFQSTLDQSRFVEQFNGLRDGTFTVVQFNNLEGLVSLPSFHFAGALIVAWALRRHNLLFWPAAALNLLLAAATVFTGAHYVVDLIGTAAMFVASIWLWRGYARRIIAAGSPAASVAQVQADMSSCYS